MTGWTEYLEYISPYRTSYYLSLLFFVVMQKPEEEKKQKAPRE